ncbi:hypothetical protein ISS37_02420 [candidate division KSB1 bacterium]|nr:hypothetical protein [candidate division KSB1 bacterium]
MLTIPLEGREYPLIPRVDFPQEMPRYPNVWFYVSKDFAASYDNAVNVVLGLFDKCNMYRVTWRSPLDGADGEVARDHWQPYGGFSNPALFHEHSLHLRYYLKALGDRLFEVKGDRTYSCWAIATSVHFEPGGSVHYLSMEEYPELQTCPFCGRIDKNVAIGDSYEKIRDPLGLEFLLEGKIRGKKIRDAFNRVSQGIRDIGGTEDRKYVERIDVGPGYFSGGINTPRLGCVLIHLSQGCTSERIYTKKSGRDKKF